VLTTYSYHVPWDLRRGKRLPWCIPGLGTAVALAINLKLSESCVGWIGIVETRIEILCTVRGTPLLTGESNPAPANFPTVFQTVSLPWKRGYKESARSDSWHLDQLLKQVDVIERAIGTSCGSLLAIGIIR
jgi:hypothetical protein